MSSRKIAERLTSARTKRERGKILSKTAQISHLEIAHELKNICYEVWTSQPTKAQKTALALENLSKINPNEEIEALAFWVAGIAELTKGKLESSIKNLDKSAEVFKKIKQEHEAANTQVAKLIALALLGRYPEALKTGKATLKVFEKYGDELAAGKIEKNLGNIVARYGQESDAEKFYLSARARFEKIDNKTELTMSDNSLANTYAELNNFYEAEKYYAQALENAQHEKMRVTEAEIEASMGNLAFFRGKFDEALRYLELSRQKYEELKMPHQMAIAELEIADIYLELNLTDEADAIYEKVSESLRKLKLQGEEARARANFGKTSLLKNDFKKAKTQLKKSSQLFFSEKNPNGAASVKLTEANLEISRKNYKAALDLIHKAEKLLAKSENRRQKLFAGWLHGETLRLLGKNKLAEKILTETCSEALKNEQSNLAQICLNSLGNLALPFDKRKAENYFKKAVRMIETLRAPLPAEEFRIAFLTDKIAPYQNLAKIYLSENELEKAFLFTERARARTLSESLNGNFSELATEGPSKLSKKLKDLREELNWFYSRLNRAETGEFELLQKEAKKREKQIAGIMRQIESMDPNFAKVSATGRNLSENAGEIDFKLLQKSLDKQKAFVSFVKYDGVISAFTITDKKIEYFADLVEENEILDLLESLQFQFGALRYGAKKLGAFVTELKKRADFYLQKLYQKLIKPLEDFIEKRDLIIVPVGAAYYVPFHALKTEEKYLIETREIVYTPSAAVWQFLQIRTPKKFEKALLIGFADEKIPLVTQEIEALQKIFPEAKILTGMDASFSNFTANAKNFDILHIACHGQFRPDNPLFSNLHLADGFITVRDIYAQKLKAEIVTLSACETGLNKISAGEEILGLARGFLSAGAKSLVLSLWTVNDKATTDLMTELYLHLQRGISVSASLRLAQINFIKNNAHPYFWAPFALIGK